MSLSCFYEPLSSLLVLKMSPNKFLKDFKMFVLMLLKINQPDFGGQSHEWTVTLLAELICCWFCHFKNTESSAQGKHLNCERQNLDLFCHLKQLCWVVCCSHYLYLVIQGVSDDHSCTSLVLLQNRFVLWKLKNVRKERREWRKKRNKLLT